MANRIKMAVEYAILAYWRLGWSFRRIARELGLHRETVSRYVRLARESAKPAKATPGTNGPDSPKPTEVTAGNSGPDNPKPARVTPGNSGLRSYCEPFREVILEKLDLGLSAQRIWQDLVSEHGFSASYSSVKRFVRHLRKTSPLPFRRMECEPGQEAQVDFGRGAPVESADGKRRYPHAFRIVLSHSRKAYSEVVWRQTTEAFIRCLENAFRRFGGVPKTLVVDNLRAAVKRADWYDPELNPKIEAFCRHYGTVVLPSKPYTPRHKGKVERGVGYLRNNALKGHVFKSLGEQNIHLADWEKQVADHRVHGTTRKHVMKLFEEAERPALLPLPPTPFPFFHEAERTVHRDAHVEVDRAYYSVPPEYLGRKIWVRWDTRLVRVFNHRFKQIACHLKRDAGRFSTDPSHIASEKISGVERGAGWLLRRASLIGTHTAEWAQAMLKERGIQGVRVLAGLLSMAGKYRSQIIEDACEAALSHGVFRLRGLRTLIKKPAIQQQFLEEHPLIRPMADYERLVHVSFQQKEETDEFIALGTPSGGQKGKGPAPGQTLPAVQSPVLALGSLSSVALSSKPARANLPYPETMVKREGENCHE